MQLNAHQNARWVQCWVAKRLPKHPSGSDVIRTPTKTLCVHQLWRRSVSKRLDTQLWVGSHALLTTKNWTLLHSLLSYFILKNVRLSNCFKVLDNFKVSKAFIWLKIMMQFPCFRWGNCPQFELFMELCFLWRLLFAINAYFKMKIEMLFQGPV